MKLKSSRSLNFSDVNLLSDKISIANSRNDVKFDLNRIIVAPMSALQNSAFNISAISSGLSLPIHRFCSVEEQHVLLREAVSTKALLNSNSMIWLSVGLNDYKQRIDPVYKYLQEHQVGILFDVANGFAFNVGQALKDFNRTYDLPNLMTGNVHTHNGFEFLEVQASQFIRVGIANGAACATKDKTGIVRGQISSIEDVANELHCASIVSDGGVKSPADVAKAFGAGADYVMIGGYLAQAKESEAQKTGYFYGGASSMQKGILGTDKTRFVEGKVLRQDDSQISLSQLVSDISDGVKSAISYSGYLDLEDFIGNGIFELVK